jgi:hypothetical protein
MFWKRISGAMGKRVEIDSCDALFRGRMSDEEWARIVAFRSRPLFLRGVLRHADAMAPFFAHNFFLNKVVTEIWRFQMLVFTLYLHETRRNDDPRSGLTVANLRAICSQLGIASPGRVSAFLNIMRVAGYLAAAPSGPDRRVARLQPTERFMRIVEDWNANVFASIDAATPERGFVDLAENMPMLGTAMRTSGAEGLLAGWDAMGPFPEVLHFAAADGGFQLMEYLSGCAIRNGEIPVIEPVDLDLANNARRFGGSRSNLIRLLDSAYAQGLLDAPPRLGRAVVLSPQMLCAFLTFIASYLGYYEQHTQIGLARIP